MARRKLTEVAHRRIVEMVRAGNHLETAARAADVSPVTVAQWLKRGEDPRERNPRYREFARAVRKAEAEVEAEMVDLVRAAAPKSWQAAMAYLERKAPRRWAKGDDGDRSVPAAAAEIDLVTQALVDDAQRPRLLELVRTVLRCQPQPHNGDTDRDNSGGRTGPASG
jgi:hypothetical protein